VFEVKVIASKMEHTHITIIKMFRIITGFALKESKDVVFGMLGKGRWIDTGSRHGNDGHYEKVPCVPFIHKCDTYIRAMQVKIEFTNGGFTAEVIEINE